MKKIKILQIISDTNIGGAGILLYNLASCIDNDKFEFIYAFPQNSALCELFDSQKEKIYSIRGGKDKSKDMHASFEISRIIKKTSPDIIHTHSALFGRIGAKIAGIHTNKIIYTKHCVFDPPRIYKNPFIKKCYKFIDNFLCGSIVAVADAAKSELAYYGVEEEKIITIINGSLPLEQLSHDEKQKAKARLGIQNEDFVVGISARLEEYQGHKTRIEAASMLPNDNIKFIFLGDGSYKSELTKYAKELCVSDRILFLGFQRNISEYVNLFDINVNCSTGTETSSLSISEGLSLGKPIIASNFGGNPNMVKEGITGYLFKKGDSSDLYKKIFLLKNDKKMLNSMSYEAKLDFEERFSAHRMAREYEKLYIRIHEDN